MSETLTPPGAARLPLGNLSALSMTAFITVLTEALPAGLLTQMGQSLRVSDAMVGQLITVYALGSLLTAIPITAMTQTWGRRTLLLTAIIGFTVVNTLTAFSESYVLTLVARFMAGVFAGIVWSLVVGYAARLVPEHLSGRAISLAMLGVPAALSLGIPAGTFLGGLIGWQWTFGVASLLCLILIAWILFRLPNFAGQSDGQPIKLGQVLKIPGIVPILFVTLTYVLAHNILYTYVVPLLGPANLSAHVDQVLLVYGVSAIVGLWVTGALIDRWLRELTLISTLIFGAVSFGIALFLSSPLAIYIGVGLWGLAYGGIPSLLQTASAKTAGDAADVAQSMIVTIWNLAIAGGGLLGGVILENWGVQGFPAVMIALLVLAYGATHFSHRHGFPKPAKA